MKNDSPEQIISNINKNVKNKRWTCLIDGCNKPAINSHILQRNGILNNVAEDFHVSEIKAIDIYAWKGKKLPNEILQIKATGTLHSHAYPTLCSDHDTQIFKPVEAHPIDFQDYQKTLLFAYRTILSLYRKEEIVMEKDTRMVNSQVLQSNPGAKVELDRISKRLKIQKHLLDLRKTVLDKIVSDFDLGTESFDHRIFMYPLTKVYASAVLICPETADHVCINIFPYEQQTLVILTTGKTISEWKTKFIGSWKDLGQSEFEKRLTGFLTRQCENWGVSPLIAKNMSEELKGKLFFARTQFLTNPSEVLEPNLISDFNLFE